MLARLRKGWATPTRHRSVADLLRACRGADKKTHFYELLPILGVHFLLLLLLLLLLFALYMDVGLQRGVQREKQQEQKSRPVGGGR